MPLFPEMPVPGLPDQPGQNGASPLAAGGNSGVIPGLEPTMLRLFQNYRPGDIGICEVDQKLQLSLPIAGWDSWDFQEEITITVGAGLTQWTPLVTVPMDEQHVVHYFYVTRGTGDNLATRLGVQYASGYRAVDGIMPDLVRLTATANIFWPDPLNLQTGITRYTPGPVALPPGSTINVYTDGTGVAATDFRTTGYFTKTKMHRAIAPMT